MGDVSSQRDSARIYAHVRGLFDALAMTSTTEAYAAVLEYSREMVDCGFAAIVLGDPGGTQTVHVATGNDADVALRVAALPAIAALFVEDGDATARVFGPQAPDSADRDTPRVLLAMRIAHTAGTAGVFVVGEPGDDEDFGAESESAAALVAASVAALVERRSLVDEHEQRQRWLSESSSLTRDLLSGEHRDPLRLFVERLRTAADADLVTVVRKDDDGRYVVFDAAGSAAEWFLGRVLQPGSLSAEVIDGGSPVLIDRLTDVGRSYETIDAVRDDAVVMIPFSTPGSGPGVLAVCRRPDQPPFMAADVAILSVFAGQIALAIELAESRDSREREALLTERDRIARDLHDHVIQRLFAIGLTMQSASVQAAPDVAERLLRSVDDIDETIGQIRATIYRLTGPILASDMSIRARAAQIAADLMPVLGFAAQLEARGPVDFVVGPDMVEDCVAFLREALSNVGRHAQATSAQVIIAAEDGKLILEVRDNGRGLSDTSRRSGLANLRTRAEKHGGTLEIDSSAGRGTALRWWVPMAV